MVLFFDEMRIYENVKAKTRTKNNSHILKTTFWVSQSDSVFRELFLITKTKKTKCEAKLTTTIITQLLFK